MVQNLRIEKRALCSGVVSRCKGHHHYFFDLDDVTLIDALYSARHIAKTYRCDIILRESGFGFHLLCPNPMRYETVQEMQRWTPCSVGQDYITLDELKGVFPTNLHWDKPTGCVLRTSGKGRRPAPRTIAIIYRSREYKYQTRVWCEIYCWITGVVPENRKIRKSQPLVVYYETASKVL